MLLKRGLQIRITLSNDNALVDTQVLRTAGPAGTYGGYILSDVRFTHVHAVPDQKHLEFVMSKLETSGFDYVYEPFESRLHQSLGPNGQYDVSSKGKILKKTYVCWSASAVTDGEKANQYAPLFGNTNAIYQTNKGLSRPIPSLSRLQINVAGMQFPGANVFDDSDPCQSYEIQELTEHTSVDKYTWAGHKGFITVDYTGHSQLFNVPELTMAESGVFSDGKFISMPLTIKTGAPFADKYDMYVFHKYRVMLKWEGRGLNLTQIM